MATLSRRLVQSHATSGCRNEGRPSLKSSSVSVKLGRNYSLKKYSERANTKQVKLTQKDHYTPIWTSTLCDPGLADEQNQNDSFDWRSVPSSASMVPQMRKGLGSSGGGVTLERSKLDLSQSQTKSQAKLEMGGGGRGNNNKNANGGGDGGDDGGDDDDYMGGEGDDEGDDNNGFIRKMAIIELFDRETVEAVLQEWFRSITDLPAGLRRAMELGLVSSAQIVRFLSIEARPTIARAMSRLAPQDLSRAFIGRMIADPSFIYKVAVEQAITVGTGVLWEVQHRGERLKEEWDLAAMNVLTLSACNLAMVWSLSPCRSYGTTARHDWQNMLQKLPNHVFDKSYPMREFNMVSRVNAFFYKAAELSLLGTVIGGAGGAVSNALAGVRKQHNPEHKLSVRVPDVVTAALATGAFMGLSGNLRYQLVYGADRAMQQNLNSITLGIFCTTALRYFNNRLGDPSRLAWLGLDNETQSNLDTQSNAYRRPSTSNAFTGFSLPSLTSLPFLNKGNASSSQPSSQSTSSKRPRRKIKRKVTLATQ